MAIRVMPRLNGNGESPSRATLTAWIARPTANSSRIAIVMIPMNGGAPPILVIIVNRPQPPTIAASEPSTSMIGLSLNCMT